MRAPRGRCVAPSHGSGLAFRWPVPGGAFRIDVDGLSAMFLLQIFLVSLLGAIYGLGYWKQTEHPRERPQAAAVLRHR